MGETNEIIPIKDCYPIRTELVTPEKAKEYLKRNIGNRALNMKHVEELVQALKSNKWDTFPTNNSITFNKYGILNDGQHRLTAISISGVSLEMWIFIKDKDTNANTSVIDAGDRRGVSQLLHKSRLDVAIIHYIDFINQGLNRFVRSSVAEYTDIYENFNKKQLQTFELLSKSTKLKISAAIRAAIFAYLVFYDDYKSINMIQDAFSAHPQTNEGLKFNNFLHDQVGSAGGQSAVVHSILLTLNYLLGYSPRQISNINIQQKTKEEIKGFLNKSVSN